MRTLIATLLLVTACSGSDVDSIAQEGKKPSVDAMWPAGCPKTLSCDEIPNPPDPNQGWTLYGSHWCDRASNGDKVAFLSCVWTRPSFPWGPITTTYMSISAPDGCEACVQTEGPVGPACATQSNGLPLYLQGDQTWVCSGG